MTVRISPFYTASSTTWREVQRDGAGTGAAERRSAWSSAAGLIQQRKRGLQERHSNAKGRNSGTENQKEEYNKQLSVMREELRELREDRRKTSENGKQLAALKEQLTETIEELQSLERLLLQQPQPSTLAALLHLTPIVKHSPRLYSWWTRMANLLMKRNCSREETSRKYGAPNTQKALELLCEEQLGSPSHIIIHTGTNDLRAQHERVA